MILIVGVGQSVRILEASDQVGGRVRTDLHEEGYRLDRGFQVLFTAYSAARRILSYDDLKPRGFDPRALLVNNGSHPLLAVRTKARPLRAPARESNSAQGTLPGR